MAPAVPCLHIAEYYQLKWEAHKCIAWNLLRRGYREWAEGRVVDPQVNNLYAPEPDEALVTCDRCDEQFEPGELEDGLCTVCIGDEERREDAQAAADAYAAQVEADYRHLARP